MANRGRPNTASVVDQCATGEGDSHAFQGIGLLQLLWMIIVVVVLRKLQNLVAPKCYCSKSAKILLFLLILTENYKDITLAKFIRHINVATY